MRKWIFFTIIAFLFAMLHSCSLNNDVLRPNCEIFEVELVGKVWTPTGQKSSETLYFNDGNLTMGNTTDTITYNLQNCNVLSLFNTTTGESKEWQIQSLDLQRLVIKEGDQATTYTPNK